MLSSKKAKNSKDKMKTAKVHVGCLGSDAEAKLKRN